MCNVDMEMHGAAGLTDKMYKRAGAKGQSAQAPEPAMTTLADVSALIACSCRSQP